MSTYIFVTGKRFDFSLAELKTVYKKAKFKFIGENFIVIETKEEIDQVKLNRLGGTMIAAKVIDKAKKENLIQKIFDILLSHHKGSKLDYGVSIYGFAAKNLRVILMKLKRLFYEEGLSSRFINKNFENISTAQYKSLRLEMGRLMKRSVVTPPRDEGVPLIIVKADDELLIGKVTAVQDIDAYSRRDFGKPFRDMQMGMMPPKLAQFMINFTDIEKGTIWDPFCGGGSMLFEAMLMGYDVIGSDINPDRVEGTKRNIEWFKADFNVPKCKVKMLQHDATKPFKHDFDAIAFEGDLGVPHGRDFDLNALYPIIQELTDLYVRFFENLKKMKCKVPVVAGFPFYVLPDGEELSLKKAIEAIKKMGFKYTIRLKYLRSHQAVGREVFRFQMK